jgi:hypothetical protein
MQFPDAAPGRVSFGPKCVPAWGDGPKYQEGIFGSE